MKPITSLILAVLLLLCGCAAQEDTPATTPATAPTPATEPSGIYDETSEMEHLTCGALRAYPLFIPDAVAVMPYGSDLLLLSGSDPMTLTRYTGEVLYPAVSVTLPPAVSPETVSVVHDAIHYYDPAQRELVFLDECLAELSRVSLPETICGGPVLSEDGRKLYYSAAEALRCLDLETGLDRLLKETRACKLTPPEVHCGGTVLSCGSTDDKGDHIQLYLDTETGQTLHESPDILALQTFEDAYFASVRDGRWEQLLLGSSEHGPTVLAPYTFGSTSFPLLQTGSAVLTTADAGENALVLDEYDLQSGKRSSRIMLHGTNPIRSVCSGFSGQIWFLRYEESYGCDVLCRWDTAASATNDSRSYLSAPYGTENPDLAGIAACRDLADTLSRTYGVQIHLWTDATVCQPWDYQLVPEHQVRVIEESLKELERFLNVYPEGFFKKAAEQTACGSLQICLVRSILGNAEANGAVEEAAGLQFWDSNRNSYLCLSTRPETLFRSACHEMSHIIDSRVLTYCKAYDDWSTLNPKDFKYTHDYASSLAGDFSRWLDGEERAFIDLYATTYPKEDRARIMEYAVAEGNEAYFASQTMQKKLHTLCLGIRQAFGLKESAQPLRWEQYLTQPIT